MILARDGHQLLPHLLGRRIERNRQLRPHRLAPQLLDLRNDSRRRERDALLATTRRPRGSTRMRVAFSTFGRFSSGSPIPIITMFSRAPWLQQPVVARHEQHLAHDLAGRQVALQAHQRRHAELAIHRTAHLARNADRVARLFRHQNRLDRPPVLQPQQITARSVTRFVSVLDLRQPDRVARGQVARAACRGSVVI